MFRVFRDLSGAGLQSGDAVTTIGNFDGVHVGHQRLFRRVVEIGRERGWIPSVVTFDPHPASIVAPSRAPKMLTTLEERLELMRREGIEQVFVIPFNREFSQWLPEDFVRRVLAEAVHAKAVLVGENFRFGKGQQGTIDTLREMGTSYGFSTEVLGSVYLRSHMVSSSGVRRLIMAGNVSLAARMLGRPYALRGDVVKGHGIGSKQTVPTLNLRTRAEVLPADGVYITRTTELNGGPQWPSITNVGYRPTFDGTELTIETYLLSALEGSTPDGITVELLRRVREERKFESPEALKQQILHDVGRAQTWFRRTAARRILCYH